MTRTLVTGAAGFTGRYVAEALTARGHEVHGLVHCEEEMRQSIPGFAQLHLGDLCDLDAVRRVTDAVRPEHVVHLAAIAFVAHGDVNEMYRVNVVGTRQLLQALMELRAKPSSILLASSANVYGNVRQGVIDESVPAAPVNDYGVSKIAMEYVASIYRETLPLIVVRPFNYTGRGQSTNFIIPKIVEHARAKAKIIKLGNLDVARDFSDVRTVADTYARLLSSPATRGQTLNVCSGRAVTLHEVLELVTQLSGHQFDVEINPAFIRPNEVRSLHGSRIRLESVIGPVQPIALEDTLRWMLNA
jgi:nucleoside-diphosphate-sugar epimerase